MSHRNEHDPVYVSLRTRLPKTKLLVDRHPEPRRVHCDTVETRFGWPGESDCLLQEFAGNTAALEADVDKHQRHMVIVPDFGRSRDLTLLHGQQHKVIRLRPFNKRGRLHVSDLP